MSDTKKFVEKTFEVFGGREQFFAAAENEISYINGLWKADIASIGRVLRSHLVVEHFLARVIEKNNPKLGDLSKARLSFFQKLELLDTSAIILQELKPGIKRLNEIRNRIAHKLEVDVTQEDKAEFLGIGIYEAMRNESEKRSGKKSGDPIDILEDFSLFAAGMLQSLSSEHKEKWQEVFSSM